MANIISEQHDLTAINFVAGMSDPGEMIRCGYRPELRRLAGEQDAAYAARIRPLVMALPEHERNVIMSAAIRRAGLDVSNGRVNVIVAGPEPAWHKLGVHVAEAVNSKEALTLSGQDFHVDKLPLSYEWNGERYVSDDAFALVRSDTGAKLSTVGSRYEVIQPAQGFEYLDTVLKRFGAKYVTAGSLYGGRKVWIQAELPAASFKLGGNDENLAYVMFTNSFGMEAAWTFPTSHRVVCANTHRIAIRDRDAKLSIRHTGNVIDKVRAAQDVLGIAVTRFESFKLAAEEMSRKPMSVRKLAADTLDKVLGIADAKSLLAGMRADASTPPTLVDAQAAVVEKLRNRGNALFAEVMERYESPTCTPRGTAWAAFNAVTEMADHGGFIGRLRGSEQDRLSRRFESILDGEADKLKQTAYALAV